MKKVPMGGEWEKNFESKKVMVSGEKRWKVGKWCVRVRINTFFLYKEAKQ